MSRGRLITIPMLVLDCGVCGMWDAMGEPSGDTQDDVAQAKELGWVCTDAYGWICPECTNPEIGEKQS